MKTTTFHIIGMCCATEQSIIEARMRALPYVNHFAINLLAEKMTVEYSGGEQNIIQELQKIGFSARVQQTNDTRTWWQKNDVLLLTIFSACLAAIGFLVEQVFAHTLSQIFFLASILTGSWKILIKSMLSVERFTLDMNVLMTVATVGAIIIGEWEEASVVIILFALSLLLEQASIKRTRRAMDSLIRQSPTTARVRRNSKEETIAVEEIAIDEVLIILPGEIIPLDGIVIAGNSFVNQSAITGESVPSEKCVNEKVYAGTINQLGMLEIRVTDFYNDTMLSKILHRIEGAQNEKAHSQQMVERFAKIYTPTVFLIAIVVVILSPLLLHNTWADSFYNALVLLVVACPCALVISTPITVVSALTTAARMGILIKGGRHLESLASLQAIAFDKTGTLSEGRLQVAHSISKNSLSQNEMMKIIFVLESRSEHHFADAIKRYAKENNVQQNDYTLDEYKTIPGKGIKGKINNAMYYFGNLSLINEIGCKINSFENEIRKYEQSGETVSFFCSEKEIIGIVTFSDSVKNNAKEVIASLKNLGVKRTIILSGDSEFAVKRFADNLHIDEHRFSLLPDNKIKAIRALKAQYSTVAMVGDGINDAPALASATVGIAMGTNGTDTAIDAADVVLMSDNLKKIVDAITLSKRTNRILKQNIIISLGLKLIIFVMGIFGFATLWMAILADDGATLLVIANALRLLKSKND